MAEGRDKQSMGVVTSLTSVNPATPYQLNYRGESSGIVRGTGADWFGPLNPLEPTAPPEVKGRGFDIPSGYNLNIRPRAYEAVTFGQLRAFADGYDLLRTVIETRKDQLARLSWNVVARSHDKKKAKDPEILDRIAKVEKFFLRPDGEHFWDDWLRMVIEDLLVLDAPAIYRRRTFGGSLYALEPIDGGTIKRVIDDWGRTPSAPTPAYQQVLKGFPAVDYTVNDLIYRPRNIRTHKVYGYSPVEQIIMTINIAIRRQVWQLQSFTEGNIPEALIGTPSTWTPDQIRAFQDWFDSLLEGNTGERRRARFVPGEVSKGYVATKPSELFGQAEEWLARIVCFAFNISAQPFVAMMNRATAETAQETAAMEGLAPLQQWVKNLIDTVILDDFGYDDIEFQWLDEDELDPNVKSTILDRETGSGLITMNEARAEKGLDPYDHPDADRPMFKSAQGYVPIYQTPDEEAEAEAMRAQIAGEGAPPADGEGAPSDELSTPATDVAPEGDEAPGDGSPATPDAQKADSAGFKPPAGVQSAAKRGLELREKWGRGGVTNSEASDQGIGSGVQRATNLKNGDNVSLDTVRRMKAFFDRHEKNYSPDKKEDDGGPTAGTIAWLLWGGDAGRSWANSVLEREGVAEKSDRPFVGGGLTKSDFDESKVTRDERGRFGSGDGAYSLSNEAKEQGWTRGQAEREGVHPEIAKVMSPTEVQELKEAIANKADQDEILEKMAPIYNGISEDPPTLVLNEDGKPPEGFFESREYNLPDGSRADFEGAIDHLRDVAEGFAKEGMGYDRQAILVLGPSAAGKSTFAEKLAIDTRSAIVDSDEAKKVIDGYRDGMGANAVHEESSLMNRAVEAQLTNVGANIIIPTVGAGSEGIGLRLDRLKEAGYTVKLVNVRVDKDEATRRMASRALSTGRPIGAGYVKGVGDRPSATYNSLKGKSDGFAEIEASGPRGTDRVTESNGLAELEQGQSVLGKSRGSGTGCCGPHGGGGVRSPLQKSSKPAGEAFYVDLERRKVVNTEKKLRARLRRFLLDAGEKVAEQVRSKLKEMGKADDDFDIDAFLSSLDLSMFEGLDDEFRDYLEDVAADSGRTALSILGSRADDLVDQVNERSVSWAREHAADLAGINEDSPYALDDTTRDMLRSTIANGIDDNLSAEEIGDLIEDAYAFSEERADLIAMTEVAAANSYGALAGYEEAKGIGITVRKSWLMLEDACDICQENADAGTIELDEEFPSGDLAPPGHPNCRCVLVPEVEDEEGDTVEGEAEDEGDEEE